MDRMIQLGSPDNINVIVSEAEMENAKLTIRYPTVFPKNGSLVLYPIGTIAERPAPAPTHRKELIYALLPNAPGESLQLTKTYHRESVIRDLS